MNKQQLASRIWRLANNMRGKIDASQYKDYILGFIFYKFLCERERTYLLSQDWTDEDIRAFDEDDEEGVKLLLDNVGYYIPYRHLYSTWVDPDEDFKAADVTDALNAFPQHIQADYADVFRDIFKDLRNRLGDLGSNDAERTKALGQILELVDPIPMGKSKDYDQLGFIYETLIGRFASGAGKSAGEFYTPHEVSRLMSEIIAYELRGRETISIYDPTSGSASLLLNIGTSVARRNGDPDSITYFAQEKMTSTYNLTRMNLVMKGVKPANIKTRNADTLDEDWPVLADTDQPLWVDACASNPPYSARWDNADRSGDPRFSEYGVAPKAKADYAFLLHNLHHMKPHGIMCIVLPHGVLFRGDAEGEIRKNLIDRGKVYAVIGLPPNIFFGTDIPTIVMVLRKEREGRDVLFVDASKCFEKDGKKNRLRARDIRRVFDAYVAREDVEGFCHVASKEEIVANGYNLNIPRYVDAGERAEEWDLRASMFGGVPDAELDALQGYWDAMPGLREDLFESEGGYSLPKADDVATAVREHPGVAAYRELFASSFDGFAEGLRSLLVDGLETLDPMSDEDRVAADVFSRAASVPLVDPYELFQALDDAWQVVSADVEAIRADGFHESVSAVDDHMVLKRQGDKEEEVPDRNEPWVGRILPFSLVQERHFADDLAAIADREAAASSAQEELSSLFEGIPEEDREGASFVKGSGSGFDMTGVTAAIAELRSEEIPELAGLRGYAGLLKAHAPLGELRAYVAAHREVAWSAMRCKRDGTYAQTSITRRVNALCAEYQAEEGSLLATLQRVVELDDVRKASDAEAKDLSKALQGKTKEFIEGIDDDTARDLLAAKWVEPVMDSFEAMSAGKVDSLVDALAHLTEKYAVTYAEVGQQIRETSRELAGMLGRLRGSDDDMLGLAELIDLLGGE